MKSKTYWIMAVWSILWLVGIGSQIKFSMNHDELRNELNAKNDQAVASAFFETALGLAARTDS